jgi:hypothetical protein
MNEKILQNSINIIRKLIEESPTSNIGSGQIAGTSQSGDDPPIRTKKQKYVYGGKGSRKLWMQYLQGK